MPTKNETKLAERANTDKPVLSYLLTFKGGIEEVFIGTPYLKGVSLLGVWYRGESGVCLYLAIKELLSVLDPSWPELLCRVSVFGADKYARGNYLKGRPWSDTCDSLLRHLRAMKKKPQDRESKILHDGHVAWNLLFLKHCVLAMPQLDDRVRPPKKRKK